VKDAAAEALVTDHRVRRRRRDRHRRGQEHLAPGPAHIPDRRSPMATVLFVCLHNAGRSQMSAALFERVAQGRHVAASAGTAPAERVHPEVVEVMREPGFDVDLSQRLPRRLTDELAQCADVVVTMGCGDQCPFIPGKRYIDWALTDPKGLSIEEVRRIRDDIAGRVDELARELDAGSGTSRA
jgi:arsenate reductase (thioredoxin)